MLTACWAWGAGGGQWGRERPAVLGTAGIGWGKPLTRSIGAHSPFWGMQKERRFWAGCKSALCWQSDEQGEHLALKLWRGKIWSRPTRWYQRNVLSEDKRNRSSLPSELSAVPIRAVRAQIPPAGKRIPSWGGIAARGACRAAGTPKAQPAPLLLRAPSSPSAPRRGRAAVTRALPWRRTWGRCPAACPRRSAGAPRSAPPAARPRSPCCRTSGPWWAPAAATARPPTPARRAAPRAATRPCFPPPRLSARGPAPARQPPGFPLAWRDPGAARPPAVTAVTAAADGLAAGPPRTRHAACRRRRVREGGARARCVLARRGGRRSVRASRRALCAQRGRSAAQQCSAARRESWAAAALSARRVRPAAGTASASHPNVRREPGSDQLYARSLFTANAL